MHFERRTEQERAPLAELLAGAKPAAGECRHVNHMQADGRVRIAWVLVAAHIHWIVEFYPAVGRCGRIDLVHAELYKRLPVANNHFAVDQRRFDVLFQRLLLLVRNFRHQIRDHHVVARHHGLPGFHLVQFTVAQVGHFHPARHIGGMYASAVKAQTHRMRRFIQLAVVESREHDIVHAVTRCHSRNQMPHHQARQPGVAVREVVNIRLFEIRQRFSVKRRQIHAVQPRQRADTRVARRRAVDANRLEIVGALLEIADGAVA